jgi:hypothetical protein
MSHSGQKPNVANEYITQRIYRPDVVKKNCPSLEDYVTQRTSTRCGLNICPSLEDFVTQRTLTKCGPNICPSSEDFVMQRTSTKCGPNICPSSEDFVSQRTLTKCGREFCPTWRTCHAADSDQMWSIKCDDQTSLREQEAGTKKKVSKDLIPIKVASRGPHKSDRAVSIESEPKKNGGNAFVTPRRKNDAVASTKMTPNDTAMSIDVIRRSYMIYLRCLKIFCVRMLVFWSGFTRIAEFACRGLEQKQQ